MDLTRSYEGIVPPEIRAAYEWREVRNAAAVLHATNPGAFADVVRVLSEFRLQSDDITEAGGAKSKVAHRLDDRFRALGWREGRHDTRLVSTLSLMPHEGAALVVVEREVVSEGYKIDNVKDRVAVDVEWHAKDGNLDRDVGAYRALYDGGIIDGGVIVTRSFSAIRALSIRLGRPGGFSTTTTTTLEKLEPRLTRGDGGGCPILAVAITDRCYSP